MALLVILIGALLILGGGTSLLAGFDITATERGSAMTIAGTVALTGGAITIAIGFSLLRLSQILNVLQTNVEDETDNHGTLSAPASALTSAEIDPVVVSEPASVAVRPLDVQKAEIEDTILTSPLKPRNTVEPPKKPGFFRRSTPSSETTPAHSKQSQDVIPSLGKATAGLATAGLATAGLAGAAILASNTGSAKEPEAEMPIEPDLDLTSALEAAVSKPAETIAEPPEPALPDDLEAELSRALAEDMQEISASERVTATEAAPDQTDTAKESEAFSFNEGLANILSKPKKRGKKLTAPTETPSDTDFHDDIIESTASSQNADSYQNDPADVKNADPDISMGVSNSGRDETDIAEMGRERAESPEDSPTILGTYNAGNGTYVMYSDGTVEAIMEQGIRKFNSMEELRKHLAQS